MRFPVAATAIFGLLSALAVAGCAIGPQPLTQLEIVDNAADKLARVSEGQEPLRGRLTLNEAFQRALAYNLDHRVEQMERSLKTAELNLARYDLLPKAVTDAGYFKRNNDSASSSFNLETNHPNFGVSTSTDRQLRTADLTFSWNILDFGLSYVRARQAADRVLIAEEARRKVVHRLLEDVRTAYWRAWSAQQLGSRLKTLEAQTRRALSQSDEQSDTRSTSPMAAATYRRELIEIQRTTRELMRELSVAKLQLAALINVDPASTFQLAAPGSTGFKLPSQQTSELVRIAAENRSELRDVAYRRRINMHEADAALLELLPGIQLYAGNNFDSNSYLLHDQWLNWGAKASWNLIKIFQYPARRDVIEAQNQLLDQRALALTMAIMTQVHVSRARLGHFQQELKIARDYETTQNKILHYVRAEHRAERVSTQTRLREELNALVGEARLNIARSAVESAKASLIASLGLDPHQPEAPTTTASTSSPRALVTASR